MLPDRDSGLRLAMLHRLSGAIASCGDIPAVVACLNEVLRSALKCERVYVFLTDPVMRDSRLYSGSHSACIAEAASTFGLDEHFIRYLCCNVAELGTGDLSAKPVGSTSIVRVPLVTLKSA